MSTPKQRHAARKNIAKAAAAAKKKRTIAHLPKATRAALGKQGNAVKRRRAAKKRGPAIGKAALRSAGVRAAPKATAAKKETPAQAARRMLRDVTARRLGSPPSSSTPQPPAHRKRERPRQ